MSRIDQKVAKEMQSIILEYPCSFDCKNDTIYSKPCIRGQVCQQLAAAGYRQVNSVVSSVLEEVKNELPAIFEFIKNSSDNDFINSLVETTLERISSKFYIKQDKISSLFSSMWSAFSEHKDIEEIADMLNDLYSIDSEFCISAIRSLFAADDFCYVKELLNAVRFSDIPYFTSWFKRLLQTAMMFPQYRHFAENFYNLYKEKFDEVE